MPTDRSWGRRPGSQDRAATQSSAGTVPAGASSARMLLLSHHSMASDGSATTVRLTFRLVDDNRAQGLDTAFWLVFEARP